MRTRAFASGLFAFIGLMACTQVERISDTYAQENFGQVEIDWKAETGPSVTLTVVAVDGGTVMEKRLSLNTLRPAT